MSSAKGKKHKPGKKGAGKKPSKKPARKPKAAEVEETSAASGETPAEEVAAASESSEASNEASAEELEDQAAEAPEAETAEGTEEPAQQASDAAQAPADEAEVAAADEAAESDDNATIEPKGPSAPVAELPRADQRRLVESLVFVADRAINAQQLGRMLKIKSALAKELVEELMAEYQGRGIELIELSGGYQFRSAASSAHVVREHIAQPPVRLTRAQLETLALVAYRQPITRPEIDDVRGVDSGSALRVLLERGLLKMLGRKDEPGRPLLYGTTPFFLDFFGMRSLKDLPTLREFTELSDENRALFKKKTGETIEEAEAALLAAEEIAQRDSLSAPATEARDASTDGGEETEGAERDGNGETEEPVEDRDLEVEADTFTAGSVQTSPDNGTDMDRQAADGDEEEERDLTPAPEA